MKGTNDSEGLSGSKANYGHSGLENTKAASTGLKGLSGLSGQRRFRGLSGQRDLYGRESVKELKADSGIDSFKGLFAGTEAKGFGRVKQVRNPYNFKGVNVLRAYADPLEKEKEEELESSSSYKDGFDYGAFNGFD